MDYFLLLSVLVSINAFNKGACDYVGSGDIGNFEVGSGGKMIYTLIYTVTVTIQIVIYYLIPLNLIF